MMIPISLASDNNYYMYMTTTIISILENRNSSEYEFYLLVTKDFKNEYKKALKSLERKYDFCTINIIVMDNVLKNIKMSIKHITYPTYYRLYLADIIGDKYDKCIYLDTDILVRHDLIDLYNTDIENFFCAGVKAIKIAQTMKAYLYSIGIHDPSNYINAGVLLINLRKIRNEKITPILIDSISNDYKIQDQDIINVVFYNKIKTIELKYNRMISYDIENDLTYLNKHFNSLELHEALINPIIVHYANACKPWLTREIIFHDEWLTFFKMSYEITSHFVKKTLCGIDKKIKNGVEYSFFTLLGVPIWEKKTMKKSKMDSYKFLIKRWYKNATHSVLNLDNPQTFNEKIQWLKLYDSTPVKTRLADKYLVREWVAEKIGEKYLIPLLGAYARFDDIDFSSLPERFVIKCNHGCGYNIIVKDKNRLDREEARRKINGWMQENFAFRTGYELHYRDIPPKIIIEDYIENKTYNDLIDYKFWCFHGKAKYIQLARERNDNGACVNFYDTNWNLVNFINSNSNNSSIQKPDNLEDMILIVEKLCHEFNYARIDLYRMDDGTIYFGEITFTPSSGVRKWNNKMIDYNLGKLLTLPSKVYNIDTRQWYKLVNEKEKKTFFQSIRIPSEKLFLAGPIVVYHQTIRSNKKRITLFGIEVYKRIKTEDEKKYYLLGIPAFRRK